ncbi:hypothetical protein RV13_GL001520 [Enterococcus raffinosus]|nr:hypothetical protein RV13_GL001520 [Enterococcus raffinosus]
MTLIIERILKKKIKQASYMKITDIEKRLDRFYNLEGKRFR